jgi:hypothetical protein
MPPRDVAIVLAAAAVVEILGWTAYYLLTRRPR